MNSPAHFRFIFRSALLGFLLAMICACSDDRPVESKPKAPDPVPAQEFLYPLESQASVREPQLLEINQEDRLIARIQDRTAEELSLLLTRAEQNVATWEEYPDFDPIEFILDGPEARLFVRSNYLQHRELVDRAARLDAFGVIDVKICERWMEFNEVMASDFPAFVDTVNYGPAAKRELLREGYIYF